MTTTATASMNERALLVQVIPGRRSRRVAEDSLSELERLADSGWYDRIVFEEICPDCGTVIPISVYQESHRLAG